MHLKILILIIPVWGVLFLLAPVEFNIIEGHRINITHSFFLTSSQCTWQEYVYYGCEHLILLDISYILFIVGKRLNLFLGLLIYQLIDAIDYFLTYNSVWYNYEDFPVSFNTTGWIILIIFALRER